MLQVRLTQQGELVKIRPINDLPEQRRSAGGSRRAITKFSKRSRKNMLERFAIIDKEKSGGATFITLTYASNMQDEELSFSHLRKFLKRLNYASETLDVVRGEKMFFAWKKEYQDRGAIHWHIMAFGLKWMDKDWLAYTWSDVIGETMPMLCSDGSVHDCPVFTRVEYCRSPRKAWYYMSKYMAKPVECRELDNSEAKTAWETIDGTPEPIPQIGVGYTRYDDSERSGFNIGTNLAKVGRFWGWEGRKNIPYASKEVAYVTCSWKEYIRFRRDLSNLFDHLRQTLIRDSVKMFWFYDFLSPYDILIAGINGTAVSKCIQWEKVK